MYENELNQIAYERVQRDEYPEQIPQIDVEPKRQELREYEDGTRERPQPKTAYIVLIDNLSGEIARLESENADIYEQNRLARQVVDDKYNSDIESELSNPINQWTALGRVVDRNLRESEWMLLSDSRLTESEKITGAEYRITLMSLKTTYARVDEAIEHMPVNPFSKLW